jgi:hypothetical protein
MKGSRFLSWTIFGLKICCAMHDLAPCVRSSMQLLRWVRAVDAYSWLHRAGVDLPLDGAIALSFFPSYPFLDNILAISVYVHETVVNYSSLPPMHTVADQRGMCPPNTWPSFYTDVYLRYERRKLTNQPAKTKSWLWPTFSLPVPSPYWAPQLCVSSEWM